MRPRNEGDAAIDGVRVLQRQPDADLVMPIRAIAKSIVLMPWGRGTVQGRLDQGVVTLKPCLRPQKLLRQHRCIGIKIRLQKFRRIGSGVDELWQRHRLTIRVRAYKVEQRAFFPADLHRKESLDVRADDLEVFPLGDLLYDQKPVAFEPFDFGYR